MKGKWDRNPKRYAIFSQAHGFGKRLKNTINSKILLTFLTVSGHCWAHGDLVGVDRFVVTYAPLKIRNLSLSKTNTSVLFKFLKHACASSCGHPGPWDSTCHLKLIGNGSILHIWRDFTAFFLNIENSSHAECFDSSQKGEVVGAAGEGGRGGAWRGDT